LNNFLFVYLFIIYRAGCQWRQLGAWMAFPFFTIKWNQKNSDKTTTSFKL